MKEAENEDGEGKRKVESLWPRIHRMPFFILRVPSLAHFRHRIYGS